MCDQQNSAWQKRQKAVALQYNSDEYAPKVAAKGVGKIAEKILEKAKESDVTLHQNAQLVDELYKMDLEQHIPPELYEVVAQVLAFVSDLDRSANKRLKQQLDIGRLRSENND